MSSDSNELGTQDDAIATQEANHDVEAPSPAASRAGPEYIDDGRWPMQVAGMASMFETTKIIDGKNNRSTHNNRRLVGVEQIDDESEPSAHGAAAPLFGGDVQQKERPVGEEQIIDDESEALSHGAAVPHEGDAREQKKMSTDVQRAATLQISELMPPTPSNAALVEDIDQIEKVSPSYLEERLCIDDEVAGVTHTEWNLRNANVPGAAPEAEEQANDSDKSRQPEGHEDRLNANDPRPHRLSSSVPGIKEAYPVDDDVICTTNAEPLIPWWKQKRTKILFGFVFAVVAALIALGVSLSSQSQRETVTKVVTTEATSFPSISVVPTLSQVPSSAPSSCVDTISNNAQTLDLLHVEATNPKFAIDGRDLVMVSSVLSKSLFSDGSLYVAFYSMVDDNRWERIGVSIEGGWSFDSFGVHVALSSGTAIVSSPSNESSESIFVYKKTDSGLWERLPQLKYSSSKNQHSCGFGLSIELDGKLMVARDSPICDTPDAVVFQTNGAYLFKKYDGEWIEIDGLSNETFQRSIDEGTAVDQVAISGDTIAVKTSDPCSWGSNTIAVPFFTSCEINLYIYDPRSDSLEPQGTLTGEKCGPMTLAGNNLALAADGGVKLYKRQGEGKSFELLQFVASSDLISNADTQSAAPPNKFYPVGDVGCLNDGQEPQEYKDAPNDFLFDSLKQCCAKWFSSMGFIDVQACTDRHDHVGFGALLSMDGDILVVGSDTRTHIFSQSDNTWTEVLTLEAYSNAYRVSGRVLIAANQKDAVAMDMANCVQLVPTAMPSMSEAPSVPCYEVEFEFSDFCDGCNDDNWEARVEMVDSDTAVIHTFSKEQGDWDRIEENDPSGAYFCEITYSYNKSLCLPPGQYRFALRQWWNPGTGPMPWYHSVRSNGQVIAQGEVKGDFDESTQFNIPFDRTMVQSPTGRPKPRPATRSPTSSPLPTMSRPSFDGNR